MPALVIVSGARVGVGRAYLEYFATRNRCIGLIKSIAADRLSGVEYRTANLLDEKTIAEIIADIHLDDIDEIILVHAVGKFKWEGEGKPEIDSNQDGIDDEVHATNVETLRNILIHLLPRIENTRLRIVAFGTMPYAHSIRWWQSYTRAKQALREYLTGLSNTRPNTHVVWVGVSSVRTEAERNLRPSADSTYWLEPSKIVAKSVSSLESDESWVELEIFEQHPEFDPHAYNEDTVRKRWLQDMQP